MNRKIASVLAAFLTAAPLSADTPTAGDSPASGSSEVDERTRQVLDQLYTLSDRARRGTPQFSLVGTVERAKNGNLLVNGEEYQLAENAVITGTFAFGKSAELRGELNSSPPRVVTRITMVEDSRGGPARAAARSDEE